MFVQIRNFSLSSDCLILNMILLWFLSALISVICCYGNMYSLDSLPVSFLTRPVEGLCSTPLLFCCTTVLELSLQRTGFVSAPECRDIETALYDRPSVSPSVHQSVRMYVFSELCSIFQYVIKRWLRALQLSGSDYGCL